MSTYADAIREAVAAAEEAPPQFKTAAFEVILGRALTRLDRPNEAFEGQGMPGRPATLRSPRRSRPTGPKSAIQDVIADGFLDTPRTISDLRGHLKRQGWGYESKELAMGALRLVRDGSLRRVGGHEGQYLYERSTQT